MALVTEAAVFGEIRIEITRFGHNVRVVFPDGGGFGWGRNILAWELEDPEAVALAESVIRGMCPPAVFADYMDEHPYHPSPFSGPKAASILRESQWTKTATTIYTKSGVSGTEQVGG